MERIGNIVVAADFSPLSDAAAARAVALARVYGAAIHLVHAIRYPLVAPAFTVPMPDGAWEGMRQAARRKLEAVRKDLESQGIATVTAEVSEDTEPSRAIEATADAHDADLVVMGTHGHGGLRHAVLGSVAERTLRSLRRPVLAVKESAAQAALPIERILLAVDFSAHSDRAADAASALARRLTATLDVVHALDLPHDYMPYASDLGMELEQRIQAGAAEGLERVRARLGDEPAPATLLARRGHPSQVIAEAAVELGSQLIVMGTRGHSGLAHVLLGSVTERTLHAAPCSVLAVAGEA